ncbi:NACHT domain-containing protein [Actinokineospora sp. NBRC 105648]|uniref:NACHT domain-containing protein n=1 Tax=Actinokineospora sp. NBRC 105648 TaxID=3032206 RepID=UPI0024A26BEA|nr:NACHT domain-containing protein [Actinokineospora sp. NBRC 105648]GLZ41115.1 hypothetical protein Acsp05_47390 [Actinokineospora sp. NBRC 105648]
MARRVWSTRSRVVSGLGWVLLAIPVIALTWWLLGKGDNGAGIANVLALPASIVGGVAGVLALVGGQRTKPRADDPGILADRLRRLLVAVITAEERTLARLLGDTGKPQPADVGFTQPDELFWRTDGGADSGSLDTIAEYYRGLRSGRLLVQGEGGAGKTVLVLRLLLDLAQEAHRANGLIRVPVRLSLPSLPESGDSPPGVLRERLDSWAAEQIASTYGIERAVVRELLARGLLLLVLDGLDEMDPDQPVRAREVLAALNISSGPDQWPVVLTCRTEHYKRLVGQGDVLEDATVVTLQPLGVEQVISWLAHRFPARAEPDGLARRWQPVAEAMRSDPAGELARCLSSPLRLYLAVSAYRRPGSQPAELVDLTDLDTHLFELLVPAVTEHQTRPDGGHYPPADVERWLGALADHLAFLGSRGMSSVDFWLSGLWLAKDNPTRPARGAALWARLLIALAPLPLVVCLLWWVVRFWNEWLSLLNAILWLCVALSFIVAFRFVYRVVRRLLLVVFGGTRQRLRAGIPWGPVSVYLFAGYSALVGLSRDDIVEGTQDRSTAGVVFAVALLAPFGAVLLRGAYLPLRTWLRFALTTRAFARRGLLPREVVPFLDWAYAAGLLRYSGDAIQFRHRDLQAYFTSPSALTSPTPRPATGRS